MDTYLKNALKTSKITTESYSTSFSLGTRMLPQKYRNGVYAVYGLVRFADEIVDTFHGHDQSAMISNFRKQTEQALEKKLSTNPIIHSFQWAYHRFDFEKEHLDAFFQSMEMDLTHKQYSRQQLKDYIYGSAEVVGLMCLKVFYEDDPQAYDTLVPPARKLGEAFQKVNFLRDLGQDYHQNGRIYFWQMQDNGFNEQSKKAIEDDIMQDFHQAFQGIVLLKPQVRLGVYMAYRYYLQLFNKIRQADAQSVSQNRFRVSNATKMMLLGKSVVRNSANLF